MQTGIYKRQQGAVSANRYIVFISLYIYTIHFSYSFFLSHRIKTTTAVHQRQIDVPSLFPCIQTLFSHPTFITCDDIIISSIDHLFFYYFLLQHTHIIDNADGIHGIHVGSWVVITSSSTVTHNRPSKRNRNNRKNLFFFFLFFLLLLFLLGFDWDSDAGWYNAMIFFTIDLVYIVSQYYISTTSSNPGALTTMGYHRHMRPALRLATCTIWWAIYRWWYILYYIRSWRCNAGNLDGQLISK